MSQVGRVRVKLLGAPRVERGAARVDFDTRKATALLAYLALEGAVRRDALAAVLWSEADDRRARGALRRTLSVLRSGVGADALVVERETIELVVDRLDVDVHRFRELVQRSAAHPHGERGCARCRRDLRRAVALVGGDFLAGFTVRDSPEFDDWQQYHAERLRHQLATALDRLVDLETAAGDAPSALEHARRRLALDPLHEPAHRSLMRLNALAGDRAAAVRQYRECVRILDDELAVPPLPETTALYERIAAGPRGGSAPALASPDAPAPAPLADPHPPLVGRDEELAQLLAAAASAGDSGALLAVEGGEGMGKTRLLRELADRHAASGASVLYATCHAADRGLAFGALVDALRPRLRESEGPRLGATAARHLAALFPELGGGEPLGRGADVGPLDELRFFAALADLVSVTLEGATPGLLILDDLHLADPTLLDFLDYLVARLPGRRLCLGLSYRPLQGAVERVQGIVARVGHLSQVTSTALGPLAVPAIETLARGVLPAPADAGALAERLAAETDGSPLVLLAYLDALRVGELDPAAAQWAVPGGAQSLLLGRLDDLPDAARQVVGAAAVIGDATDADLLREVSGRDEEEVVTALEELVRRGMLQEPSDLPGDAGYRFRHALHRTVVVDSLSRARRRLLHQRAAAALVRRAGGRGLGGLSARIASHLAAAGRDDEAARYHLEAAGQASRVFAHAEAAEQYRAALALGASDVVAVQSALGDAETLRGQYGEALTAYERAAAHARVEQLPDLEQRLGRLHLRLGGWAMAARHLDAALGAWPRRDRAGQARLLADLALAEHRAGDPAAARAHAAEASRTASASRDTAARAHAHNVGAILARAEGDVAAARDELRRARTLASSVADPAVRVAVLNNAALVERESGDLDQAVALTDEALVLCAEVGDRHREAALRSNLADLLHLQGRRAEAMQALRSSVEIFAEVGDRGRLRPEIWMLVEW